MNSKLGEDGKLSGNRYVDTSLSIIYNSKLMAAGSKILRTKTKEISGSLENNKEAIYKFYKRRGTFIKQCTAKKVI